MANKSIATHKPSVERLLELLSSIIAREGHSLSWYTSRKGRMWITLKGFNPATYTTSVEVAEPDNLAAVQDAWHVLLWAHYPKVAQLSAPLNTWLTSRAVADALGEAQTWLDSLPSHVDLATGEVDLGLPSTTRRAETSTDDESSSS